MLVLVEKYRAGSPFCGKFVLFKPVLFVQVWPAGIQDVGPGERLNASGGMLSKPSSSGFPPLLPSQLEAFLALSPLRLFDYSRLEDAVTGSTIDARASRDLITDSLESAVNGFSRTSSGISGAKWIGYLRTGGGRCL